VATLVPLTSAQLLHRRRPREHRGPRKRRGDSLGASESVNLNEAPLSGIY